MYRAGRRAACLPMHSLTLDLALHDVCLSGAPTKNSVSASVQLFLKVG